MLKTYCTETKFYNNMMHFCAITNSNACSLFDRFKSLQCPKKYQLLLKNACVSKFFRMLPRTPLVGLQRPPRPPAGFHLGRPTIFYCAAALFKSYLQEKKDFDRSRILYEGGAE